MTEFFDTVSEPIRYEGPDSDNPLAFRAHHGGHAWSSSVWVTYHAVASSTLAWTVIRLARKTLDEMTRLIGLRPFCPTMGVAVLEPTRPPAKLKRVVDVRRNPGDEVVDRCLIQLHPCRRELDTDLLPNVALKFP